MSISRLIWIAALNLEILEVAFSQDQPPLPALDEIVARPISRDDKIKLISQLVANQKVGLENQNALIEMARLYSQHFDPKNEKPDYQTSKQYYTLALARNKSNSLNAISARLELADLIGLESNDSELMYGLLQQVIEVNAEAIYKDEITPEMITRLSELTAKDKALNIDEKSMEHQQQIKDRLQSAKDGVLSRYNSFRKVAIHYMVEKVYLRDGAVGLKNLHERWRNDSMARDIVREIVIQKTTLPEE